jgi:predicted DNA-binding transcriptional regulator YafY
VLHFGSAVQILNPPELKESYKAEVKKMNGLTTIVPQKT